MKIVATQFNLKNNALEIYLSGCKGHCKNCHNPELKDFDVGEDFRSSLPSILRKIEQFDIIENIWILGGEPLDQDISDLLVLIGTLITTGRKLWLFTRYELADIDQRVLKLFDYIKTGPYDETKARKHVIYGVELATENQTIYRRAVDY